MCAHTFIHCIHLSPINMLMLSAIHTSTIQGNWNSLKEGTGTRTETETGKVVIKASDIHTQFTKS